MNDFTTKSRSLLLEVKKIERMVTDFQIDLQLNDSQMIDGAIIANDSLEKSATTQKL